jgi:hypothetical protein
MYLNLSPPSVECAGRLTRLRGVECVGNPQESQFNLQDAFKRFFDPVTVNNVVWLLKEYRENGASPCFWTRALR